MCEFIGSYHSFGACFLVMSLHFEYESDNLFPGITRYGFKRLKVIEVERGSLCHKPD